MLNLVSESSYWAIFLIAFSAAVDKVGKTRAGLRGLGVPDMIPFRNIMTNEWFDTSSVIGDYRTELLSKHGELFQFEVDALCFSS
jgi:hypothetical protein